MGRNIKDSDETKLRILRAAKKEFSEKGYSGARMSSISKRAGVNQALLHYHFDSKENLYLHIFQTVMGTDINDLTNRIGNEIKSWKTSPETELCAVLYILAHGHIERHDEDMSRLFAREIAEDQGIIHDFARKYMMPRIILFNDFILHGIELGIFEISNPLMFTMSTISFLHHYVHGEEFIKGTKWHKTLYKDKKNTLYRYILEQTFKVLAPAGKIIKIPELTKEQTDKLDNFVKEISDLYSIK